MRLCGKKKQIKPKTHQQKRTFTSNKFMKNTLYFLLFSSIFFTSCEEEFDPKIPASEPDLVVEGVIEAGEQPTIPYVILTRSVPFFTEIGQEELNDIFVHDAEVKVREGDQEVTLQELCIDDLSAEQKELASGLFGIDLTQININFCVYADLSFSMLGEAGKTYDLTINVEGKTITATTTIPFHVPLDTLYFQAPPGEPNDSLMELTVFITDPAGEANYYRYFTQVEDEPLLPGFPSSTDDRIFDGLNFQFPLAKAESRELNFEDIDLNTLGLYHRGDSVTIKWTTIDAAHYEFWNTLEFNAANSGPFSTYTLIESNIQGGLGVWGGYNASYTNLVVPAE